MKPGERVRELREAHGWTQEELGRRAGLNKETVNRFELGGGNRTSTINKLSAALGLSASSLLSDSDSTADLAATTLTADERELIELWRSPRVPAAFRTNTMDILRDFAARARARRHTA